MHNDIERILLTEEQIKEKVAELGKILAEEYKDKNPVVVGVLKGVLWRSECWISIQKSLQGSYHDLQNHLRSIRFHWRRGRDKHGLADCRLL